MARITALLAACALALTGCAIGQEPEPGQLAVIADRTTEVDTARMTMTMSITLPSFGGEIIVRSEGVMDLARDAFHATIEQVDATGGGMRGAEAPDVTGEIIVIDGNQYQGGDLARQLQADLPEGHWLHVQLPENAQSGLFPGANGQISPLELITQLGELGGEVSSEGRDELRGTAVTHLRAETSMRELAMAQATVGRDVEEIEGQVEVYGAQLDSIPVVIEVWADDDDVLRRVRIDTDMTAAMADVPGAGEGEARSVMDLELYDFGVEVEITAPPADVVWDFDPEMTDFEVQTELGGTAIDEGFEDFGTSAAIPSGATKHTPGGPLAGARDVFAELPYPLGAERIEVSSSRLVYAVAALGENPVNDLATFYFQQLPVHRWTVTGDSGSAGGPDDLETSLLSIEGYGRSATIEIQDDRSGELLVAITLD
jgi:hypothetical protein